MSPADIRINVSGGSANFGNVSQGDHGDIRVNQSIQFEQNDVDRFYQAVTELAKQKGISDSDYLRLRNRVNQLVKDPSQPGIMVTIKGLYEDYAWATKPLMALFAAVLP
ncbi:MAG TPA: hypothetical protein DCW94_01015 [Porticoccaceae bacterium]|jgi:hypothetical protein|nr:hypothetical protein [Porticoccaceae bacterium]